MFYGQVTNGCFNNSHNIFNLDNNERAIYIVDIFSYKNKNISDLLNREEKELKKNFPEISIKKISTFGRYKSNNQIFYFDGTCKNYGDILFFTGNPKDSIFENKKIVLSSEFFSKKLKTEEKISSYVFNFEKEKIALLNKLRFNTDDNSKTLSNLFLDLKINQKVLKNFLLPPFKFVKKRKLKKIEVQLTSYVPKGNIFFSPFSFLEPQIGNINFDESGNIEKIEIKDEGLQNIVSCNFNYENQLIRKISTQYISTTYSGEKTYRKEWKSINENIYYDENAMIVEKGSDVYGRSMYNIITINENWKDGIINNTYSIDEKNYTIEFRENLEKDCFFDKEDFFDKICFEDISLTKFPLKAKILDYDFSINNDTKKLVFIIESVNTNKKTVLKYFYDKSENLKNVTLFYDEKIIKKWDLNYSFYK